MAIMIPKYDRPNPITTSLIGNKTEPISTKEEGKYFSGMRML